MKLERLGDIVKITSGGTPLTSKREYYIDGNIPWVKTGDLKVRHLHRIPDSITQLGLDNSSAKIFPVNTVLIAMYGATIGNCSILKTSAATNQACAALLPSDKINEEYLFFFLLSIKNELINKGVGGGQPNISATILKDIKIPLPPLSEQIRIAEFLSQAEDLITQRKQSINLLDELLKSTFLDMFLGTNISKYEKTRLGNVVKIKGGKRLPKGETFEETKTNFPYIRVTDFYENSVKVESIKYISSKIQEKIKNYTISSNDVYISIAGTIGLAGCIPEELDQANLTENAAKIIFDKKIINKKYLVYYLNSPHVQQEIKTKTNAVGVPKLALFRIEELNFILPPIELQNQFADISSKTEKLKKQYQESLFELQNMYGALSQNTFREGLKVK